MSEIFGFIVGIAVGICLVRIIDNFTQDEVAHKWEEYPGMHGYGYERRCRECDRHEWRLIAGKKSWTCDEIGNGACDQEPSDENSK